MSARVAGQRMRPELGGRGSHGASAFILVAEAGVSAAGRFAWMFEPGEEVAEEGVGSGSI